MLLLSKIYHDAYAFKERSFYVFSELFSLAHVKVYLFFSLAVNTSLWMFSWLFYRQVREDMIILHYNVDFGVDLVGQPNRIFIIPALGSFIILFNFLLLPIFIKRYDFRLFSNFALAAALLANVFLSLSLGPLYMINFS
jgi:hypothetical protein